MKIIYEKFLKECLLYLYNKLENKGYKPPESCNIVENTASDYGPGRMIPMPCRQGNRPRHPYYKDCIDIDDSEFNDTNILLALDEDNNEKDNQ